MDIKNTTNRPLRVPLAGGKRLFLNPGGQGQISPKAAEHPPVKALIDDGIIEIQGVPPGKRSGDGAPNSGISGAGNAPASGGMRHTGDR